MSLNEIDRGITDGAEPGFAKFVTDRRSGKIRGATIVAPRAGELISQITAAIGRGPDARGSWRTSSTRTRPRPTY